MPGRRNLHSATNGSSAQVLVGATNATLKCDRTASGTFNECNVEIRFEVKTNISGQTPTVGVKCETRLAYTDRRGREDWSYSEEDRKYVGVSTGEASGRANIRVSLDEATYARIMEAECDLLSVSF